MKDKSPQTDSLDLGIVIALKEEFDIFFPAIQKSYQSERDPRTGDFFFLFEHPGKDSQKPFRCVASFVGRMGPIEAALMTARMISRWSPETMVMLGIAAGIHEDAMLGDVVVADSVDSYIDRGKIDQSANQNSFSIQFSGQVYQCSADLIRFVNTFGYIHPKAYNDWRQSCSQYIGELIKERTSNKLRIAKLIPPLVSFREGPVASGPVVIASKAFKEKLQQRNRSFLAVEMEAGGMMAAIRQEIKQKRSLVLRGISDYGDERKKNLDKIKGGVFRQYAMHNTIQLLWKLLEADAFPHSSTILSNAQTEYTNNENVTEHTDIIAIAALEESKKVPQPHPSSLPSDANLATKLRNILIENFDIEEFRTLCSDLEVSFDGLRGEGLSGKSRELVSFLQRRKQLDKLIVSLRTSRLDINL